MLLGLRAASVSWCCLNDVESSHAAGGRGQLVMSQYIPRDHTEGLGQRTRAVVAIGDCRLSV